MDYIIYLIYLMLFIYLVIFIIKSFKSLKYLIQNRKCFKYALFPKFPVKLKECSKLPDTFGFEYAKKACEENKYPYIYWDGIELTKPITKKDYGFIVKKEDMETFLTAKADELKFNEAEKKEFVRYWSKTSLDKKWKKYKIYFLQNEEVQNLYPLYVEPTPESINRVQIIISKAKRQDKPYPQTLKPIERKGFTLVEWGGSITKQ